MSRTYRRTNKGQKIDWLPKIWESDLNPDYVYRYGYRMKLYCKEKADWIKKNSHRKKDVDDYFWLDYSKAPSHWNHDYSTVPRRASDRELLHKIKKGELDPDDTVFRDGKKPVIYYW